MSQADKLLAKDALRFPSAIHSSVKQMGVLTQEPHLHSFCREVTGETSNIQELLGPTARSSGASSSPEGFLAPGAVPPG